MYLCFAGKYWRGFASLSIPGCAALPTRMTEKPMDSILRIVNHRDFVLLLALVSGLLLGERTRPLAEISMWSLGLVMVFATTGFSFRSWIPISNALRPLAVSALLNYVVYGILVVGLAYVLFYEGNFSFYVGFILVVAAPPGPSIIPFAALLSGDNTFSVTGVFGLHLLAMVFTPLILLVLLGQTMIDPMVILKIMAQLIVLPLIISRMLRHRAILPKIETVRKTVIKWGFLLVIAPIVGMSAPVFLTEPVSVLMISAVLLVTMFGGGLLYHFLMSRAGRDRGFIVSSTLMMAIKSSAFAAVTAFTFFPGDARVALPPAVVSVFVTLFIIFYSFVVRMYDRRRKPSMK